MLITNVYKIERYLGSQSLSLLSAPNDLSAPALAQYNTFISNIVSIYESQNLNGNIPVFFKDADGSPSSSSSLTSLQSGEEYIFISKPTAPFPFAIPAIGTIIGQPPTSTPTPSPCPLFPPCCPSVKFDANLVTLSDGNMYAPISAEVSGLSPNTSYSYSFSGLGANWPSKISPLSGVLNPVSTTDTIDAMFSFYATTGNYPNVLPFDLDADLDSSYVRNNIYSILELKLTPSNSDCSVISDRITVRCSGCVPSAPVPVNYRPSPSFVGATNGKITLGPGCCDKPVPIAVDVTNVKIGENYSYEFNVWPSSVVITPVSGSIGFGQNQGKISALVDMNTQESSIIKCSVTDPATNKVYVDFIGMQCNSSC